MLGSRRFRRIPLFHVLLIVILAYTSLTPGRDGMRRLHTYTHIIQVLYSSGDFVKMVWLRKCSLCVIKNPPFLQHIGLKCYISLCMFTTNGPCVVMKHDIWRKYHYNCFVTFSCLKQLYLFFNMYVMQR